MGRLLVRVFFAQSDGKTSHAHESSAVLILPLLLLAVPALAAGYPGKMFGQLYGSAYHFHLGDGNHRGWAGSFLGLGLAYLLYRRSDEHPALLAPSHGLSNTDPWTGCMQGIPPRRTAVCSADWLDRSLSDRRHHEPDRACLLWCPAKNPQSPDRHRDRLCAGDGVRGASACPLRGAAMTEHILFLDCGGPDGRCAGCHDAAPKQHTLIRLVSALGAFCRCSAVCMSRSFTIRKRAVSSFPKSIHWCRSLALICGWPSTVGVSRC